MAKPKYTVTNANSLSWQVLEGYAGVEIKSLGTANGQTMELFRFAPNTPFPEHVHVGPEFVFFDGGTGTPQRSMVGNGMVKHWGGRYRGQ